MHKYKLVRLFVVFTFALLTGVVSAKEPVSADGTLSMLGEATYRYWGFKLYEASFYSGCGQKVLQTWDRECTYQLDLHYDRTFTPEDFTRSSEKILKRIYEERYESIASGLKKFQALFEKVNDGDTYSLKYTPSGNISLSLNGVFKGEVNDPEFARAYFQIWLNEDGIDEDNARVLKGLRS